MDRVREFIRREVVLVVAALLAAASCAAVPPDAAYAGYIDWRTLALLFCLMVVVAGFRALGVLAACGRWLVAHAASPRGVAAVLVAVVFVSSMAVTNDVALVTFTPLALVALNAAHLESRTCLVVALMTVAANLGSMLTPIGNPQNLYLFTSSGMGVADFLALMAPYTALSAALLAALVFACFKGKGRGGRRSAPRRAAEAQSAMLGTPEGPHWREHPVKLAICLVLFCLCLLTVAGVLDVGALLAAILVAVALCDAGLFKRVDYALLLTFVALFVFVGNMARIGAVHDALSALVGQSALLAAVGASQAISNVPAAVLLSGFTDQWPALIVGANLGGLGTLIASMASLITFKAISIGRIKGRGRYLGVFTLVNAVFLAALLCEAAALGAL